MKRFVPWLVTAGLTIIIVAAILYWGAGSIWQPPASTPGADYGRTAQAAVEHPPDWKKIDTGQGFSFYAPPHTQFEKLPGEDSARGDIQGPTFHLQSDFGFYSNTLEDAKTYPNYSEANVTIDGRPGILRQATMGEGDYFIGLYIREAVFHYEYPGRWAALEVHGSTTTPQVRAEVELMLRTITVDRPPPPKNGAK